MCGKSVAPIVSQPGGGLRLKISGNATVAVAQEPRRINGMSGNASFGHRNFQPRAATEAGRGSVSLESTRW